MHDFTSRKTTEPDPAASYNTYLTDFVAAMAMMHQDVSMIDVGSLNTAPSNVALSVVSFHFCLSKSPSLTMHAPFPELDHQTNRPHLHLQPWTRRSHQLRAGVQVSPQAALRLPEPCSDYTQR